MSVKSAGHGIFLILARSILDRFIETKDKESQRWLDSLSATEAVIPSDVTVVTVADREADIYDFLALPRSENSEHASNSRLLEPFCKIS